MDGKLQLTAGVVLVLGAWLLPRHIARVRFSLGPALLLDAAPWFAGAALLFAATGRPIFAGVVIFALAGGFGLADYTMRDTLREPVLFCSVAEFPQLFTHPHLYLPFAGPRLVIGGAVAGIAAGAALLALEPPLLSPAPVRALLAAMVIFAAAVAIGCEPLLGGAARLMRRFRPTHDPDADAARLGPFGMLFVHGIIARAERVERRQPFAAPAILRMASVEAPAGPVVIVQSESFFDARRLSPLVPARLLAGFDTCCREAATFGRLHVPGWGANTMRTEFAVLTGIRDEELGYDRYNPYYAFARIPIASQIWRLRNRGYRTICLHPFDRRFFRRDLIMPALGFEVFLGRETLGGTRVPPYCPDPDLGRQVLRVLDESGPRTAIFVITMDNHGPWHLGPAAKGESPIDAAYMPQGEELSRYLDGLRRADEMLQILRDGLQRRGANGVLTFYGDHLPSLPRVFGHFGFDEPHSDYVIWPGRDAAPRRLDIPAHRLGRMVVDAVLDQEHGRAAPATSVASFAVG